MLTQRQAITGRLLGRVMAALAVEVAINWICLRWLSSAQGSWGPPLAALIAMSVAMSVAVSLLWIVDYDNGWAYVTAGLLAPSPIAVHGATRDAVATLSSRTDTCSIGAVQRLAGPTDGIPSTSVVHRLTCTAAGTRQMMFDNDVGSPGERLTAWWNPQARLDPRPVSGPGAPEARRRGAPRPPPLRIQVR
jgi:hypothetical protein